MALHDEASGRPWTIREQTIYDPVSGLIIQFAVGDDGLPRLRLFGKLPFGNRELGFDANGIEAFAGVALAGSCRLTDLLAPGTREHPVGDGTP